MAKAPPPKKPMGNPLTNKYGPLPGWGWLLLAVGGYYLYKKYSASQAAAAQTAATQALVQSVPQGNLTVTSPSGATVSGNAGSVLSLLGSGGGSPGAAGNSPGNTAAPLGNQTPWTPTQAPAGSPQSTPLQPALAPATPTSPLQSVASLATPTVLPTGSVNPFGPANLPGQPVGSPGDSLTYLGQTYQPNVSPTIVGQNPSTGIYDYTASGAPVGSIAGYTDTPAGQTLAAAVTSPGYITQVNTATGQAVGPAAPNSSAQGYFTSNWQPNAVAGTAGNVYSPGQAPVYNGQTGQWGYVTEVANQTGGFG